MSAGGTDTRLDGRSGFRRSFAEAPQACAGGRGETLCWMEAETPARLRPSDLQNPEDFHRRLADWLMAQR